MKRFFCILSIVLTLFVANGSLSAQVVKPAFNTGDNILNFSVGYGGKGFGIKASYERFMVSLLDDKAAISVGANLNNSIKISNSVIDTDYIYESRTWVGDWLSVGVIGSFHYWFVDKLDTYAQLGVNVGLTLGDFDTYAFCGWTSALGARYRLSKDFSINAEVGYIVGSYFTVGVTVPLIIND